MSAAGFSATAVAYGPARMGFGLFVPEFRSAFSISTSTVGLVSSLGFFGFLVGLCIADRMLTLKGPREPVLAGLIAATVGMGIVAAAPNVVVLSAGVFLAMSSAGFSWAPFNNAVSRSVWDEDRPSALSIVSSGTALGIAGAGLAALAISMTGLSWRICWGVFAAGSAMVILWNWMALREVAGTPGDGPDGEWRDLFHAPAIPLFAIGLVYGITSAIYISFAADRIRDVGGVPGMPAVAAPALVFVFYGLFGVAGLATGSVKALTGLAQLVRLLMIAGGASLALLAFMPGSWVGLVLSAGLQGVFVMMMSAVLSFWSERLFPALPSKSFSGVLITVAAGSVLGPALAGFFSDAFGARAMFVGAALLPVATAVALRRKHIHERPSQDPAARPEAG